MGHLSEAIGGGPPVNGDEGWWVGAPDGALPTDWQVCGAIAMEVYLHVTTGDQQYRSSNALDHNLTPVREPGTCALVSLGVLGLLLSRRAS